MRNYDLAVFCTVQSPENTLNPAGGTSRPGYGEPIDLDAPRQNPVSCQVEVSPYPLHGGDGHEDPTQSAGVLGRR